MLRGSGPDNVWQRRAISPVKKDSEIRGKARALLSHVATKICFSFGKTLRGQNLTHHASLERSNLCSVQSSRLNFVKPA